MKAQIKNTVLDLVTDFMYYDRKEDEDLPKGEIENSIKNGDTTVDEIIEVFSTELKKQLNTA